MGLAEAHIGVDEQRVEAYRGAVALGNRARCRIDDAVRFSLDEVREGMARIERGSGKAGFALGSGMAARLRAAQERLGTLARSFLACRTFRLLRFGGYADICPAHGGTHDDVGAQDGFVLLLPEFQQQVAIVGIDPALQEGRRHGMNRHTAFCADQLDAAEPAVENLRAERGLQLLAHLDPAGMIHAAIGRLAAGPIVIRAIGF